MLPVGCGLRKEPNFLLSALFGLTLASILAAPAMSGAAGPVSANVPTDPAVTAPAPQVLTLEEALLAAKALLLNGRLDEAEKIYSALLQHSTIDEEIRLEAAFQLAQIRLAQGKNRQAINLFLEILNRQPGLARVRLELARAYFLDKNYEDAAFQFEMVKGGDLPPEVLANIDRFLDAIRRQKNWTLDFSLSPVTDSNLNQASGEREECLATEWGLLCRDLTDKAGGFGLSANATANYFWRFHQDWGLRATLGFYGTAYEEDEYDDYSLYAALGPRYLWESGEASLQPTFRKRWVGGRQYSEENGLRLDARRIYKRLILDAGAAWAMTSYEDAYIHSVLKGPSWNLFFQPRYILTNQTFVQAGVAFMRDDTKVKAYASDSWRYALGAYHNFSYGFSLFVEGSLMETDYKARQSYATRDNKWVSAVRKDDIWQLSSTLSSNVFERYGLTPSLQYTFTRRDSNIWSREYDRHRLNFLVNYRL